MHNELFIGCSKWVHRSTLSIWIDPCLFDPCFIFEDISYIQPLQQRNVLKTLRIHTALKHMKEEEKKKNKGPAIVIYFL
jgi:hypothetical protein